MSCHKADSECQVATSEKKNRLIDQSVLLIFKARRELGLGDKVYDMRQMLDERMRSVNQSVDKADWRQVGINSANLISIILGQISGRGGGSREIEVLLQDAPPSVRRETGESIRKLMNKSQTLGFAPEGVVSDLKEKDALNELVSELKGTLARAIKLYDKKEID